MEVYRLVQSAFIYPLNGKGAALYGGRWNSIGIEVIYTAANRSLAMAEVLVHLHLADLPKDLHMLSINIPDELPLTILDDTQLPPGWNRFPATAATAALGDQFILEGKYVAMKVPSVVTQGDFNYLINPAHADFKHISIIDNQPFPFDRRFLRSERLN